MVNETIVKSFLTLVQTGSITEAANTLYLTQQAVSKQLSKLEQDLNCTLVLRERGKLRLTPVGEIYYQAFSKMDDIFNKAHTKAIRLTDDYKNTIYIGQPELLDIHACSYPYLFPFQQSNPDVKVIYRSAPLWQTTQWLLSGSIDALYTWYHEIINRPDIQYVPLALQTEMLVVAATHPKATEDATYRDFVDEPFFFSEIPEGSEHPMNERLIDVGFPVENLIATDNMLSSCAAIEQRAGVTFLMENCHILENPRYKAYPTPNKMTMVLAYRTDNKKRCLRHLIEAARDWSREQGFDEKG